MPSQANSFERIWNGFWTRGGGGGGGLFFLGEGREGALGGGAGDGLGEGEGEGEG